MHDDFTHCLCSIYNALCREMEPELVPCCRKFGLRIVIFNPLACVDASVNPSTFTDLSNSGGFFAGKVASPDAEAPKGGRFDPNSRLGTMYRARYLRSGFFDALEYLKPIAVRAQRLAPYRSSLCDD